MNEFEDRQSLTFIRAIVWGFAGFFYSAVFLGVWRYLDLGGAEWWHVPAAAAVSGAFVATFYSAKRTAIVGAVAGMVSSQILLIYFPSATHVWPLVLATLLAGLGLGVMASFSHVQRQGALKVLLAGAVAGGVAGSAIGTLVLSLPGAAPPGLLTFLLTPATGGMFYFSALRPKPGGVHQIPNWLSMGLAASWLSVIVGSSMWFLSLSLSHHIDPDVQLAVQAVFSEVPGALVGGVLGGAAAGAALELLNVRWVSREQVRTRRQAGSGHAV